MEKETAKKKIKELVEKYEQVFKSGQSKKYTEEETKMGFILPMFEALGWNTSNKNEVSAEEHVKSAGRVDYGFYLNERSKFYLEAKPLKADLHKEDYAKQAIRYSWNKGVSWAVLTDFESIKVFNAQAISQYLADKMFFEIPYSEYVGRFEQLWLLSKEAFEKDLIDKEAEKVGKKMQRVSVSSTLYKDLNECRDILTRDLGACNPKIDKDSLDEGIQKLLDRLIFIRVAEDRGIEQNTLIPIIRQWKGEAIAFESMVNKFRELDKIYNSDLFTEHPFEKWEDFGGATEKVIKKLYGKEGYYEYDFKVMPADVLGTVYEHYLGHRLSQSKKGMTLDKDAKKRKEQGIYYTPDFIVDYIVRNALKPVLDRCKSINDLKKIKVLDPSCGSGSFLIKALNVIYDKYREFSNTSDESIVRMTILTENIYGVDLDEQAVEIAQLNLLINALYRREKFPRLDHIKNGNSLISGTDKELQKYFGKNYRDKKSFNWQEEFPEVFAQGGFDVIIGNPPYINVENLLEDERNYLMNKYEGATKRFDIYSIFIEKSLSLLNKQGFLSFIIPYPFLNQNYAEKIRNKILREYNLHQIIDLSDVKIFGDAVVRNCIIVIENNKSIDNKVLVKKAMNDKEAQFIEQISKTFFDQVFFLNLPKNMFRLELDNKNNNLIEKIEQKSIKMKAIFYVNWGARSGNVKKYVVKEPLNEFCKKMLNARNIERYDINYTNDYLIYKEKELYNPMFKELFESPKIIVRDISGKSRLKSTIDYDKYYAEHTVSLSVPAHFLKNVKRKSFSITDEQVSLSKKYQLEYVVANINSKLVDWYFKQKLGGGLHVYPNDVKNLPIYQINFSNSEEKAKHDELAKLAEKILDLNKELQKTPENSNKYNSIKSEIEKTDKKIDEEVYKLYGLTEEEIKIVEGN